MSADDLKKAWQNAVEPPKAWQGDLFFYNRLGQKIRYGYAPAQGPKKGTVVLTHGYGENIDLYYETMKRYQDMGYEIWAMDWQGHGHSERDDPEQPLKPSGRGMLRHARDLDFFVNNVVKTRHNPKTPLIMSTHSMGGHIGLLYLKKFPGVFDAAVMSAPMFDIYRLGMGSWARPFIRFIFNAASFLGLRDVHVPGNDEILGFFKSIGRRLKNMFNKPASLRSEIRSLIKNATPDADLGRPTFGWIASTYKTITASLDKDFLKSIKTPILIGSADDEDLVANDAHERAAALIPNAKQVFIKNADHGLWFENDEPFEKWWNHVRSFVNNAKAINPHKKENNKDINKIVSGKDLAKTLRGRTVSMKRCPFNYKPNDISPT